MKPYEAHLPADVPTGVYFRLGRGGLTAMTRCLWLALCLATVALHAQTTVYWDRNGTTAGASTTPTGTWNTSGGGTSNWNSSANGTSGTSSWTAGNNAVFSAGTDATGTYTVTLGANMDVGNLTFEEGTATITANTLNLVGSGGSTIDVASGRTATVNSILGGSVTLNKTGTGTFITGGSGFNTHTGAVNINAGVFEIAKTAYVGGIDNAAAVSVATGATLRFNGSSAYTQETIGPLSGGGTVTNVGAAAVNFVIADGGVSTTFSGTLTDGTNDLNLVKNAGAGTLTLSGANSYDGTTTISTGALNIQNNSALGTTTGGTTVASGAALEIQGGIAVGAEALTLSGTGVGNNGALRNVSGINSYAGNITLGAATEIQSDAGSLTLSGGISGAGQNLTFDGAGNTTVSGVIGTTSGTLTKTGSGTTTLSGANTYTGATTVSAGTLNIQNNTALGTTAGGTTVAAGAALELQGGITVGAEALSLAGTGVTGNGALRNVSGTNAYAGNLTLTSATEIQSDAGTLSLSGTVSGAGQNLTFDGAGNTAVSGVIGTTTGTLTKTGAGTTTLSANNTYTGNTAVQQGTLVLSGTTSSGTIDISSGAVLELNAASTLSNNANTTFTGTGTLRKTGSASSAWATTVATYALGSGALIDVQAGTFDGGSNLAPNNEVWTSNLADLNIATGATFHGGATAVRVDALTGGGKIEWGWDSNTSFTFGVDNGSGDFSGYIVNYGGVATQNNTYYKEGTGTQTFSGSTANNYIYGTQIKDGTLQLNKTAGVNALGDGTGLVTVGDGVGAAESASLSLLNSNQIANATDLLVKSDGKLNLGSQSETFDDLGSTGTIKVNSGGALTVDKVGGTITAGEATGALTGVLDIDGLFTLNGGTLGAADGSGSTGTLAHTGTSLLEINGDLTFAGTFQLGGGTVKLTDADVNIGTLNITANTILDFSGNSTLTLDTLSFLNSSVTLTIINWTQYVDGLFTANWPGATFDLSNNGNTAPMNQIIFNGWTASDTGWDSYNDEIRPVVPEPSTYGAIFSLLTLGCWLWHRRRQTVR